MTYIKSEAGHQALKDRLLLTPRQRAAFIQFDGKRSLSDVLQATAGLGVSAADIDHLFALGLLVPAPEAAETPPEARLRAAQAARLTSQERYKKAYPLAAQLTASLGLRGFRLNLAVEGAGNLEALQALFPRIREAVGHEKALPLEDALGD
jgi:hypothetical protein